MKKEDKKATKRIHKTFYIISIIIFLGILVNNAYIMINWFKSKKMNEKEMAEIEENLVITEVEEIEIVEEEEEDNTNIETVNPPKDQTDDYWHYIKMPLIDVNVEELQKINSDTVGFIRVKGTNINYPVVQTKNNSYYLDYSFRRQKNSAGWIFMDYRNDAFELNNNTIIYGHSRIDTTMFGTLKNILKTNWINNKDNYIVHLSLLKENTLWQVFSVYTIPVESYYLTTKFNNNKQYENWLKTMISRSEYNFNTTVNTNDKILTLSTCYENVNKRVIMHAKLIKRSDK